MHAQVGSGKSWNKIAAALPFARESFPNQLPPSMHRARQARRSAAASRHCSPPSLGRCTGSRASSGCLGAPPTHHRWGARTALETKSCGRGAREWVQSNGCALMMIVSRRVQSIGCVCALMCAMRRPSVWTCSLRMPPRPKCTRASAPGGSRALTVLCLHYYRIHFLLAFAGHVDPRHCTRQPCHG